MKQGCWISDIQSACDNSDCVTEYDSESNEMYLFCCCNTNFCNSKVTWKKAPTKLTTTTTDIPVTDLDSGRTTVMHFFEESQMIWLWIVIGLILLLTVILILILSRFEEDLAKPEAQTITCDGPGYTSNSHNVDNLKLVSLIGQGKYGTVWKGLIDHENHVALKIFPSQHKQYFLNERDIYNVPLLEHDSILRYLGSDERRTIDDRIEYMLILSLAELGCLHDWLLENTTSLDEFYGMSTSMAQGLSHLHSTLTKGGQTKPTICHRDINSKNILVKANMTCCIADFSFALKTNGSRYEYRGEMILAETKSIMEVGTLRYMAPEILEGAVNLKDCESALKQIDIYSLGLVLWELATRCRDFYPNSNSAPPYMVPYEADVGKHPSYERMQNLVSRQKIRPSFPTTWISNGKTKLIKEICEDCWDADSEARITSLCVEERLKSLSRQIKSANGSRTSPFGDIETATDEKKNHNLSKRQQKAISKPNKKERSPFKLAGMKLKRYRIDKTFQGLHGMRSMIHKRIFKHMKLDNDDFSNIVAGSSQSAPPTPKPMAMRPTNLDIVPHLYKCGPNPERTIEAQTSKELAKLRSIKTKESARLDKKILCDSKLSLQRHQPGLDPGVRNPVDLFRPRIVVSKSANTMFDSNVEIHNLKRQRSLEVFREVFGQQKNPYLRDPSERVKTPGDVPPSVRKKTRGRASKTLSLYDDRMMGWGNTI